HLIIEGKTCDKGLQVISMNAGTRANVIPGFAQVMVEKQPGLAEKVNALDMGFEVKAEEKEDGILISTTGVLGHAAMPEHARNAIGQILLVLKELGVQGDLLRLADVIGTTSDGKGLGIAMQDTLSGKLTASMDLFRVEKGTVSAVIDIRFPLTAGQEELLGLARMALPGMKVSCDACRGGHYVPEDSELVTGLLKAYENATGEKGEAIAIGGGTYAHYMEEGVAFGASFPWEDDMAHQSNEYMRLETLYKNMRIFANTIVELAAE
ncbi:MAG: hypothetical protein CW338_09830, partial [Clostridiales bacterium]|nr:hypothetical protein [Clostridiales bacterium]